MGRRTYIEVSDPSPFGEDFDESILEDPGIDSTYIEGYSDVRRQRELDMRAGRPTEPLRHRLQWARAKTFDGSQADGRRVMHWQTKKRYRTLKYDEALKLGYNLKQNPAIKKGEDGLAYLNEQVLMIADARTAAANLKRDRQNQSEAQEAPRRAMQDAVDRFNRDTKGAHAQEFAFIGDDDPDEIAKGKKKRSR